MIQLDSHSAVAINNNNIGVLSHTCTGTELDGVLIVTLSSDGGGSNDFEGWVVNYDGIPLKRVISKSITNIVRSDTAIYILENPPEGTAFIGVGTGGANEYFGIFSASFTGVETGGDYTSASNSGSASNPNVSITTTTDNCVIYDSINAAIENSAFSATSGQTILDQLNIGTGITSRGGQSYEAVTTATSYNQAYSLASSTGPWTNCAIVLRPVGGRMKMIGVGSIIFS